jgi:predicted Zn-dependent protease
VTSRLEELRGQLERRAPGAWELYEKTADSLEIETGPGESTSVSRSERGWAARWWTGGSPRFACASSPEALEQAVSEGSRVESAPEGAPVWPTGTSSARTPPGPVEPPPDLFNELHVRIAAESRGEAALKSLTLRRGASEERVLNARGLDVSFPTAVFDGIAHAVGRKGSRACEGRAVFRWDGRPDLDALARRLVDRATLPLSDRPSPIERGEWLLEPSVAAALLAGLAPLFCGESLPRWMHRGEVFSPAVTVVDDASADAHYDGEGTPTRRVMIVQKGVLSSKLYDLRGAARAGAASTGHGVRPSYRVPPVARPRRIFFEIASPAPARELLSSVRRGLFASALTSPARFDFQRDRYEFEFTGIAVIGGRAAGGVAGATARGRISQLLRRIRALSTDRQFFPMPYPVGAPTLLVERSEFE